MYKRQDVWFQPTLNKDNISGRVSVKMKVSAPEGKKVSAHLVLKDRENNQDVYKRQVVFFYS